MLVFNGTCRVLVFSGPRTVNPDVMVCAHDVTLGSPFLLKGNTLQEKIPIEEKSSEKTFEVIVITTVTNLIYNSSSQRQSVIIINIIIIIVTTIIIILVKGRASLSQRQM